MKIEFNWPRFIGVTLVISLLVVFILRKKIMDHPMTQKKIEIMEAIYKNEPDSVKLLIKEAVDSSFYME
jgi:hypothetical protein